MTEKECFADLRRYTAQRFKVEEELAHWSAQLFPSADGLPYVGTDPGSDHIWVATGFSGDGLSLGTISGKIIAQTILGQKHPLASVYSSHRFKPLASARQFLQEQMSVAKHMVGDRFTTPRASFDDIAPGEGRVVKVNGKQVAAYREPDGRLHAHSAVCTHLKVRTPHSPRAQGSLQCIVKYNDSERTFDCPCHGSRFSVCGNVLEGPALRDLEDLLEDTSAPVPPPPPPPAAQAMDKQSAKH